MRLGNACGLTIISGRIPSAVVGISASGNMMPIVPFCPALDANLSPMAGIRSCLIRILAILPPFSSRVINALSTYPILPFLELIDSSTNASELVILFVAIPISIVLSLMIEFSRINPEFSSILL